MIRLLRRMALLAGGMLLCLAAGCKKAATPPAASAPAATTPALLPFQDSTLPIAARVDDLVARMTLAEKAQQLQQDAPPIDRLGVPAYHWWNEALHGVARNGVATVFPQAIGLAATWDTDLHHDVATVISIEARAKHAQALQNGIRSIYTGLDFWSPNVNIFRDPRWGRGQETYGEDPYLTARFGVAFVRGLQGDDPKWFRAIATPKHFAVHSGPESERHQFDARVSPTDLWSTYLPAFEACVREGHAYSVMAAYQRLDGVPCSANARLLTDILRKQWGFQGYVVSDVDAVYDIFAGHHYADSPMAAAALAVKAGCDLNGGGTFALLPGALQAGLATEADLDRAVKRVMTARFRLGMFEPPDQAPFADIGPAMNDTPEHDALSRQAARESIVILRNAGDLLPLRKDLNTLAVIGPTADSLPVLLANYHGTPARPVTLLQGIRNAVPASTRILYTPGCPLVPELMPLEEPVPATCLFTDATRTRPGLVGSYFRNLAFVSWPLMVRVDPLVDFNWTTQAARDGLDLREPFLVRWSGVLVPPDTGSYQLGLDGQDGYRLWLDDKLLVDEWQEGPRRFSGARVDLKKDVPCSLRIEYFHSAGDAAIQLRWTRPDGQPPFADAVRLSQRADAVVMVLGLTPELEREEAVTNYAGFNMGDRTTLDLPQSQEDLLEAVCATGKPVVLVLTGGSALSVNWAAAHVPAIVDVWYPGQDGGAALADVLFGDYNPAGRLPVTFYKSVADLPPFDDYNMQNRTYRYFTGAPLFPFGFGLSYTHFDYRDLETQPAAPAADQNLIVRVKVRNSGDRPGDEVVQLYLTHLAADAPVPLRELQGFKRVHLAPAEERTVQFTLTPRQLAIVDADGRRIDHPGDVKLQVGPNSATGLTQTVTLRGAATEPPYAYVEPAVK